MTNKKLFFALSGPAVSIVLVMLAFYRVDWSMFLSSLRKVSPGWLFPASLAMIAAIAVRSLRWSVVCGPRTRYRFSPFWRAQTFGYLGNLFFPARAGELIRVVALRSFSGIPGAHALSSAVMDRIADGLAAVLLLGMVAIWLRIGFLQGRIFVWFAVFFGSLALLAVVFVIWGNRLTTVLSNISRRSHRAERAIDKYLQAFQAAQPLRRPGRLATVGGLTGLSFGCDALVTWLATLAFGWRLPLSSGLVITLFLALASTLPSAPGYVGVYQIACVFALKFYRVDDSSALAYSVVLQLLSFGTIVLQGAFITFVYGFKTLSVITARSIGETG